MVLPKAMMKDLTVNFVSLVDKAANKTRFAIFKSADGEPVSEESAIEKAAEAAKATAVNKNWGDDAFWFSQNYGVPVGASFSDVMNAVTAQQELEKNRWIMEDYFFILRNVLKGIVCDPNQANKAAAIKKATDEFTSATIVLFKTLTVEKAAGMFNDGSPEMKVEGQTPSANAATGATADVGAADQPVTTEVQKSEEEIKAERETIERDIASLTAKLQDPALQFATGRDGVASNGADGVTAQVAPAADANAPIAEVAKADGEVASEAPAASPLEEIQKSMTAMLEKFGADLIVTVDSRINAAVEVMKQEVTTKVTTVEKSMEQIKSAPGVSNANLDFAESEAKRQEVKKGDDSSWAGFTSIGGGMKKNQKNK